MSLPKSRKEEYEEIRESKLDSLQRLSNEKIKEEIKKINKVDDKKIKKQKNG